MFIKTELIKKINETYYRNYQETKMFQVSLDTTSEELNNLIWIVKDLDIEFKYMLSDLWMEMYGTSENYCPISSTVIELYNTLHNISHRVTDTIFSRTKRQTDAFYEVVKLLKVSENSALVGGCVRDSILGHTPKDFDFVSDIDYDALEIMFKKAGFKVQEEGKQFLVMIVSKNGEQFEVANFRTDGMYEDGRRPESVETGNIYDDGKRRDLTVNALYLNLTTMLVIDPNAQGINDILSKTLRFVGKPSERLKEDKLRVWRFYRFLKRLDGFEAHPKSLKAVRTQIQEDNLNMKKLISFHKLAVVEGLIVDEIDTSFTDMERIRLEVERMVGL